MSVIFVVAPIITPVAWPIFAAAAAAAAAQLGLRTASRELVERQPGGVTLDVDNAQALAEGVLPEQHVEFTDGRVRVTVTRDPRGKVTVHAEGAGLSNAELTALGEQLVQRTLQQYAYQRVTQTLLARDFKVVHQERDANQVVRIKFRKFEP
jgi:hypothetical protein